MLCSVNEASQCYFRLASCVMFLRIKRKASLYSIKKTGNSWKCTVQSTETFAIHEVHKYVNG
jgi:hypothetical protein